MSSHQDKVINDVRRRQKGEDPIFNYWADECVCNPYRADSGKNPVTGQDFVAGDPTRDDLDLYCKDQERLDKTNADKKPWVNPCVAFLADNPQATVEKNPPPGDLMWKAMAYDCICRHVNKGKNPYGRDMPLPESLRSWGEKNCEVLLQSYLAVIWPDVLETFAKDEDDQSLKFYGRRIRRTLLNAGYKTPEARRAVVEQALKLVTEVSKGEASRHTEETGKVIAELKALGWNTLNLYVNVPYKKTDPDKAGFERQDKAIKAVKKVFEKYPTFYDPARPKEGQKLRVDTAEQVFKSMTQPAPKQQAKQQAKEESPAIQLSPELSEKDRLKAELRKLGKETLELYVDDTYPYRKTHPSYKKNPEYKAKADRYESDPAFKDKIDKLVDKQKAARAAVLSVFKDGEKYPQYYTKAEESDPKLKITNIAKRDAITREVISEM